MHKQIRRRDWLTRDGRIRVQLRNLAFYHASRQPPSLHQKTKSPTRVAIYPSIKGTYLIP